jgi:hypothetical protein
MMIYLLVEHTDNLEIFNQAEPVPRRPEDLPFSPEAVPLLLFLGGTSRGFPIMRNLNVTTTFLLNVSKCRSSQLIHRGMTVNICYHYVLEWYSGVQIC